MPATRGVPAAEQYRLVMECRRSGLTDSEWCLEHGIRLNTFYTWITRLRQKYSCDISASAGIRAPEGPHDVVKIDIIPEEAVPRPVSGGPFLPVTGSCSMEPLSVSQIDDTGLIEIVTQNATLRFSGSVDPVLFEKALVMIGGFR